MEDVSLDDMIKQKKMENRRNKGRRNRDNDGDVEMGSSRGPGYSTRGPRQRNRNRSTPYKKNKYTTSGDSSKAWKHDFYGKEDEEIEETGWRKKEKKEDDLLDGTSVIIDNLHWEITEAELKTVFESKVGVVKSVKIYYDRTGRSQGKGEVVFDKHSDAQTALSLDGKQMKGRTIEVVLKSPKQKRRFDRGGDRRNDRGGDRRNGRGDDRRNDTGTRITFVNRTSRR
mmetsp:Transcript_23341/g.39858  ORF Transcript_23341/g.39858 Transcript_23341/m.39858 type:complete len:227 (-) Transcript_23341:86-766(-)